jgi:hypothetical protein
VLYHRAQRIVRVLGRDYSLPSTGEALLLLIDDRAPEEDAPSVAVHALATPVYVRPPIDRTLEKPAVLELIAAAARTEHDTWNRAIASHSAVQSFLASGFGEAAG